MIDTLRTGAEQLAGLIAAREVSCEEVARAHLDTIAAHDPELHVFLHVDPEQTLARARARDEAGGGGPLHGVPIALKDLFCTQDVPTTAGSRVLEGYRPPYNATVVERCEAAGPRERRQDEHGRVRDGLVHGALGLRADAQPLGSGPRARRIQRRLGCGGCGRHGPDLPRHRHGRFDPPAGRTLRRRRAQAHVRRGVALRRGRVRLVARPGRPVRTQRARLRARVLGNRGLRSVGLDLRGHARARRRCPSAKTCADFASQRSRWRASRASSPGSPRRSPARSRSRAGSERRCTRRRSNSRSRHMPSRPTT